VQLVQQRSAGNKQAKLEGCAFAMPPVVSALHAQCPAGCLLLLSLYSIVDAQRTASQHMLTPLLLSATHHMLTPLSSLLNATNHTTTTH
jgi:hypothetical protein